MTGGGAGPASGTCSDWRYYVADCVASDPCEPHGDCAACTGDAACGWCAASWTCMAGGPTGPDSGSCGDWRYNASECAAPDPCNTHWDCAACTGDAACGWCAASSTCMTGGPTGPDAGSCGDWRYNASECVTTDPCEVNGDCGSCTAASACGWCEASVTCMTGDSGGPDSGWCTDWRYNPTSCPAPPDPCDVHTDCGGCTADAGCGWCEATWSCQTGGSSGPTGGYCSDWRYYASDCAPPDPCNSHWDCASCTGDAACGWCEADYTCMTGGASGPATGSCGDWRYYDYDCP
jgi:hypothetical protein